MIVVVPSIRLNLLEVVSQLGIHELAEELNSYLFLSVIFLGLSLYLSWRGDVCAA